MAFLWKRRYRAGRNVWVIYYRDKNGKQRSKVIGETDRRTAEKIFAKFQTDLANEMFGIKEIKKITLAQYYEEYLELARNEKAPRTFEREVQILKPFRKHFENGNIYLNNIDVVGLRNYRNKRLAAISEETVNLEFRHLKAIFNIAKSLGYLRFNPFKEIKPIRVPQSDLPKFLELDAIESVREAFKGDDFETLVEFYLLKGARLTEALTLTLEDVDLKRNLLTIRSSNTKGKKHRVIFFEEDHKLKNLLLNLPRRKDNLLFGPLNGGPQWSAEWVCKKISRVLTKCGFPWATVHTFRHTYISHLVMAGVPLTTVQEIVGHASFSTTLRYAHLAPKHKNEMSNKRPY